MIFTWLARTRTVLQRGGCEYVQIKKPSKSSNSNFTRLIAAPVRNFTSNHVKTADKQSQCYRKWRISTSSVIYHRQFHTTRRNDNPLLLILVKKLVAVITGRSLRIWLRKYPHFRKRVKQILGALVIGGTMYECLIHIYFRESAPITGRKRYIALTNTQIAGVAQAEYDQVLQENNGKVIDSRDERWQKLKNIVVRIISGNQDIEFFREQKWTVTLIDSEECNALCLPTGDVVVFTGILELLDHNMEQIAVVLAHEMAHVYLKHSAEQVSVSVQIENVLMYILVALWALMSSDVAAFIASWVKSHIATILLHKPYSRVLEDEADEVGLELMAKACFDVREASNVWRIMEIYSILTNQHVPEILSTHPSNSHRMRTLDDLSYSATLRRLSCGCQSLPEEDPRDHWRKQYAYAVTSSC